MKPASLPEYHKSIILVLNLSSELFRSFALECFWIVTRKQLFKIVLRHQGRPHALKRNSLRPPSKPARRLPLLECSW